MKIKNFSQGNFTQTPNEFINSLYPPPSVAIYVWMVSKPDNWNFRQKDLLKVAHVNDRRTLQKYLDPILSDGWISRSRPRIKNGKFGSYEYAIWPFPMAKLSDKFQEVSSDPTVMQKMSSGDKSQYSIFVMWQELHSEKNAHFNNTIVSSNTIVKEESKKEVVTAPCSLSEVTSLFFHKLKQLPSLDEKGALIWAQWLSGKFMQHYESTNWKVKKRGKSTSMKSWKMAVATWFDRKAESGTFRRFAPTDSRDYFTVMKGSTGSEPEIDNMFND